MTRRPYALALLAALASASCKTIPPDAYGVRRIRIEGAERMDEAAIRACLATTERSEFGFDLGTSSELTCGEPPFDGGRARVRFFAWPWSEWPEYDQSVFERDLERIERWYRARGFYDAEVVGAAFDPPSAGESDEIPAEGDAPCERRRDGEGCPVEITVTVNEGEPVRVSSFVVSGHEDLPERVQRRIERAMELDVGDRFDEAVYDAGKARIQLALQEFGYACGRVAGRVDVDPDAHEARVAIALDPGPRNVFGRVIVQVLGEAGSIPIETVRAVTDIDSGTWYSRSRVLAAQRAVYALGAFSSVEVEAVPRRGVDPLAHPPSELAEDDPFAEPPADAPLVCSGILDVSVRVTPGRNTQYGLGFGMQSGTVYYQQSGIENPRQWDVHLLAYYEHRNFFGGLRRLRIQDRPKIVFPEIFPNPGTGPQVGNELILEFRQPAFLEPRTTFTINGRYDLGPDPFYGIRRHSVDAGVNVGRPFWNGRLVLSVGVHGNAYNVIGSRSGGGDVGTAPWAGEVPEGVRDVSDYIVSFLEQYMTLDMRDDPRNPRRGFYVSLAAHEAGLAGLSDWRYFRLLGDVRGYVPLPARLVFAARFGLGAMIVDPGSVESQVEPVAAALGPQQYRLRAGGPNSHRGFTAGSLGDNADGFTALDGGLWRWEASAELRVRLNESFGTVFFADMGDLSRGDTFRFDYIRLAVGLGFRYYTVVGPLRLDFGYLVKGAQRIGPDGPGARAASGHIFDWLPGAISLTIGEAF